MAGARLRAAAELRAEGWSGGAGAVELRAAEEAEGWSGATDPQPKDERKHHGQRAWVHESCSLTTPGCSLGTSCVSLGMSGCSL